MIQTAAQSVGMFIGARFLIGFGLSFGGMVLSALQPQILLIAVNSQRRANADHGNRVSPISWSSDIGLQFPMVLWSRCVGAILLRPVGGLLT